MEALRGCCQDRGLRREMTKEIWALRRKLQIWKKEDQAERLLQKQQFARFSALANDTSQSRTDLRDAEGRPIDPGYWGLEVTKHFRCIMQADTDNLSLTEEQQQMIYGYYPDAPEITAELVTEAIMTMKCDRVSGDRELSTNLLIESAATVAPRLAREFTEIVRNE